MTSSLTQAPIAPLLERLFAQAEKAHSPALRAMSREEREHFMQSKTEYLDFYEQIKDLWLPVSQETGILLYQLVRGSGAKTIVEFGTSFGLSTLYMAAALRDNGGGRIITCEFEHAKVAQAQQHFLEGGVADLVEIRAGDALVTLAHDLPPAIDVLLLDGAKSIYNEVLTLVEPNLRSGALIVADNTDYSPQYLERVRSPQHGYLSTKVGDDVELSIRL